MAKQMTIAVPMSGCLSSSRHAAPTTSSNGLNSVPSRLTDAGRSASSRAVYSTSATFSSSEGWNCSGPAPSQRVAPLMVTPIPGSITATVSANATPSSAGVSRLTAARPLRENQYMANRPIRPRKTYRFRYMAGSPPLPWSRDSAELAE